MIGVAANLMAGVCLEFLSGAPFSPLTSSVYEIDLQLADCRHYPALKNPRCEVCGRLTSQPELAAIDA